MIFVFNSVPERWHGHIPTNVKMVATGPYAYATDDSWTFRQLSNRDGYQGELLNCYSDEPDDITIVGQLPPDRLDATEWNELPPCTRFYVNGEPLVSGTPLPGLERRIWVMRADGTNNADCDDGGTIHPEPDWDIDIIADPQKSEQLPLGTQFRFRSWPERWRQDIEKESTDFSDRVFVVCNNTDDCFNGKGQGRCFRTEGQGTTENGCFRGFADVLPTDDIEILQPVVEEEPAHVEVELAVGTRFRFRSWPERYGPYREWTRGVLFEVGTKNKTWQAKEGQGFRKAGGPDDHVASFEWGVLPSDDIEIMKSTQLPPGTRFLVHDEPILGLRDRVWVMNDDGANNANCDDGGVIHPEPDWNLEIIQPEEPVQATQVDLAVGTLFKFNTIPERWKNILEGVDSNTVFKIVENNGFNGEGQPLEIHKWDGLPSYQHCYYSRINGVLATDDIEIVTSELPLGARFRFNSPPVRWSQHQRHEVEHDTIFHVVEYEGFHGVGQAVQREESGIPWCNKDGVLSTDDIEIMEKPALPFPLGMRFRFRSIPERWLSSLPHDISGVFEVTENPGFRGEGQCINRVDSDSTWYDHRDGVLPSDDIEVVMTAEQKATQVEEKAAQATEVRSGMVFFFNKVPEAWIGKVVLNTLMVLTRKTTDPQFVPNSWHYRELSDTQDDPLMVCVFEEPIDHDVTFIGQLPPDQMGATVFKPEFLTTITLVDARPTGREIAADWRDKYETAKEAAEKGWKVAEEFKAGNKRAWSKAHGLQLDNDELRSNWKELNEKHIALVGRADDSNASAALGWQRATKFQQLNVKLTSELDHLKRREPQLLKTEPQLSEVVFDADRDDCAFFDSDGEVSQEDCGCGDCAPRLRTRLARFLKRIW